MVLRMGAWGSGAFQNDSALDWFAELEARGVSALRKLLSAVAATGEDEYLDVDDGAPAVAAAEIVAAALGRGRDRVTKPVIAWLDANAGAIVADDMALARRAVERVLGGNSELHALWDEGTDRAWHEDVGVLVERLGGDPTAATRRPERAAMPDHAQSKMALLTFLKVRGLEPTEAEKARIEATTDGDEIRTWLARVVDARSVAAMFGD
jgi:hypothetical protein